MAWSDELQVPNVAWRACRGYLWRMHASTHAGHPAEMPCALALDACCSCSAISYNLPGYRSKTS